MLKRLVISRTRVKLLKLFFLNREREFYLREIAKLTGDNLNSVRRELNNLVKIKIIEERKRGNQKLYKVNKNSPIHEELRKLILKTVGIGDTLRENLLKLNNVVYALIYGSFATGEEVEESDIDLLIVGDLDEEKVIEVIRRLEYELTREINYILWSTKEFEKRVKERNHLLLDIVEKPIIMIIGDENEFRKIVKGWINKKNKSR
ncbi:MAG: nucleotidyltransferase domain-containing protein [Candidatus Aenigmarchaeota archaeon]|nr:nucleotidyltransferase domain-containing protein [Candidatus Aenigmarchaeota archaeon]